MVKTARDRAEAAARQANGAAVNVKGTGLPAGPYDGMFGKDGAEF